MIGRAVSAGLCGLLVLIMFGAAALAILSSLGPFRDNPAGTGTNSGSPVAVADIPRDYLAFYVAAARTCPGMDWSILAAIGKIESDHGRSTLPGVRAGSNAAGAQGVMQFLPATWASVTARHPPPPGGATPPNPYSAFDAIFTAAAYLCDSGASNPATLNRAIFTYNHSNQYVADVLAQARQYAESATTTPDDGRQLAASDGGTGAAAAISFARAQIGRPYIWGGNGETGFDCSGLTKAAYSAAGVSLPRTADQQFRAGPRLPATEPLQRGDLVFYGNPSTRLTHVALYIGGNQVIQARDVGTLIEIDPLPRTGYAGASRPTGQSAGLR